MDRPAVYTLPFRTATESRELTSTIVYSVQAPHIELVQEVPGTPWTAAPGNAVHHLGYFTDNLLESARLLEDNGFTFEMTADMPGSELALFAYYVDASGTRIEIVDRALFPDFPAFLRSQAQVADMLLTVLRFNFGSPQGDPRKQSELIVCRT